MSELIFSAKQVWGKKPLFCCIALEDLYEAPELFSCFITSGKVTFMWFVALFFLFMESLESLLLAGKPDDKLRSTSIYGLAICFMCMQVSAYSNCMFSGETLLHFQKL